MIDTLRIYEELAQTMDAPAAEKIARVFGMMYEDLRNTVTKTEFNELKEIVRDLSEAQKRTEQRVEEMAEAQKEMAQAQKELTEAQKETQKALTRLARQVGGLSDMLGGDLEDVAYIVLHDVLRRELGWQVGVLERTWQLWNRQPEEVNIFGQALDPARPGTAIWIVGEAKHNLTGKEVDRFVGQVARARKHLAGEIFPVCFCYRARPEVQQKVRDVGIRLVFSYGKLV